MGCIGIAFLLCLTWVLGKNLAQSAGVFAIDFVILVVNVGIILAIYVCWSLLFLKLKIDNQDLSLHFGFYTKVLSKETFKGYGISGSTYRILHLLDENDNVMQVQAFLFEKHEELLAEIQSWLDPKGLIYLPKVSHLKQKDDGIYFIFSGDDLYFDQIRSFSFGSVTENGASGMVMQVRRFEEVVFPYSDCNFELAKLMVEGYFAKGENELIYQPLLEPKKPAMPTRSWRLNIEESDDMN